MDSDKTKLYFVEFARSARTDIWSVGSRLRLIEDFIKDEHDAQTTEKFNSVMQKMLELDDEMTELVSLLDTNILGISDRDEELIKDYESLNSNDEMVIYVSDAPTSKHLYTFLVKYGIGTKVNNFRSPANFKKVYNIVYIDLDDTRKARDIIRQNAVGTYGGRYFINSLGKSIFEDHFDFLYKKKLKYDKSMFK